MHDIKPRVKCSYCPYEDTRRMAVVTHMRLKHPSSRGVALSFSKSYADEDTNSSSSNSGPPPTSTFGVPNSISGPEVPTTCGVPNPMPSYSITPNYVGQSRFPKVVLEDERTEPSRISELYPDISITVGETVVEPFEKSDWSVEVKSGKSDVELPRIFKETTGVEQESTKVDLKLKLQSYQNISFKLTGSQKNGFEELEPEVILHENNNDRPEQGPAEKDESEDKMKSIQATNTKHSKDGQVSEKSDKIDYDNDPLANCNGDDDLDVKRRLQSYPNISFEVTLTPNKRRDRLKRKFEPEVIMYDESDFVIEQEKEARRVLTSTRFNSENVKENLM